MDLNYGSIVPLIGGETIAMERIFEKKPEYILSYEPFKANDNHIVEHYKTVPYYLVDDNRKPNIPDVDVINTVCPCAGLSSLSTTSNSDAAANDWMRTTANFVLGTLSPKVFWGENAPRLASKMGRPIVEDLRKIGQNFGYSFSLYKTKSILHGLSQTRDRTFYFFWKGQQVPQFDYIKRKHEKIEDTIRSTKRDLKDPMSILTNDRVPSENAYYKYCLEEIEGGINHATFAEKITKSTNVLDHIEAHTTYDKVSHWMSSKGFSKEATRCETMYLKLKAGGNIMRKNVEIPKDYIGAFVGHYPTSLTHPDEDRFLTIRECMSIMKLPSDFILQGGKKNLNHICQNVPVTTAMDMAEHVHKFVDGRLSNQMIDADFVIQDNKSQKLEYQKNGLQLDEFMI